MASLEVGRRREPEVEDDSEEENVAMTDGVISKSGPGKLQTKKTSSNYFKPIFWLRLSLLSLRGLSQMIKGF